MKVRITATGTRPLLMHNVRMASPFDPYAKRLTTLTSAKRSNQRTEEDRLEIARAEWEGSLYYEASIGPYLPAANLFACLVKSAKWTRTGPKIFGGVALMGDLALPVLYRGPRDLEGLWGGGVFGSEYVDLRSVSSNPSAAKSPKVDRCRPIFRAWAFESEAEVDTKVIDFEKFQEVVDFAGSAIGIGDYRQVYGRFEAKVSAL